MKSILKLAAILTVALSYFSSPVQATDHDDLPLDTDNSVTAPQACYPHSNITDASGRTFEFSHTDALQQIQENAIETVRNRFATAMASSLSTERALQNTSFSVAESIENWLRNSLENGILEAMPLRAALAAYKIDLSQRLSLYNNLEGDASEQRVLEHARYLERRRATVTYFNLRNAMESFRWSSGVQNTFARASLCPSGFYHPTARETMHQALRFEQWIQRDRLMDPVAHDRIRSSLLDETTFEYRFSMRMNLPAAGEDLVNFARNDLQTAPVSENETIFLATIPRHESAETREHRLHRREYLERYLDHQTRHIPLQQFFINSCINGRGQVVKPELDFALNLSLSGEPKIILTASVETSTSLHSHRFDVGLVQARRITDLDPSEEETYGRFSNPVMNILARANASSLYDQDGNLNQSAIEGLWFSLHPSCLDRPASSTQRRQPRQHGHHRRHGHHRPRSHHH